MSYILLHKCLEQELCWTLRLSKAAGAVNLASVGSWSLSILHFLLLLKTAGGSCAEPGDFISFRAHVTMFCSFFSSVNVDFHLSQLGWNLKSKWISKTWNNFQACNFCKVYMIFACIQARVPYINHCKPQSSFIMRICMALKMIYSHCSFLCPPRGSNIPYQSDSDLKPPSMMNLFWNKSLMHYK